MQLIADTSGLDALIMRFEDARATLPGLLQEAVQEAGHLLAEDLGAAAPVGPIEGPAGGTPPPGDGEGKLRDSFYVQDESETSVSVRTTQPQKLDYVVNGRGEVLPVVKKALMWPGLPHPVKRAGPSQANDFVTPVLDSFDVAEALQPVVDEIAVIIEG